MAASDLGISTEVVLTIYSAFTLSSRIEKIGEVQIYAFVPEMIPVYVLRLAHVGIDYWNVLC